MKLKALIKEITETLKEYQVKPEYKTVDGTRIDLAVLKNNEKLLAIEFESTYAWIDRRVIYNAIKAYRQGFPNLVIIYPFNKNAIEKSWVMNYVKEIGITMQIIKPDETIKTLNTVLGITKIAPPKIEKII